MNSEDEWQRLHPTLTIKVKNALKVLIENYSVIYGDREKINEVCEEFGVQLKQCCDDIVNKSENDKQQMILDVENLYKDYLKLSKELKNDNDIDFPDSTPLLEILNTLQEKVTELLRIRTERLEIYEQLKDKELKNDNDIDFPDSTPLLEILNTLQEKVTELLRIRTERLEIYEQLKDKERTLCAVLRENEISEASGIPSSPYLNKLRSQVNKLEINKKHLDTEIESLRKKAENMMNKLAIRPILSVELFCFDGTSTSITFSKDTHEELLKLIEKLEEEQVNMMEEANRLRETLSVMWTRINESYTTREEILSKCNGFSRDQIATLKEELKRCEEIKRKNLSYYIDSVKQELNDWWEKCYYSEEQKNNFKPFHETFCSEDLLQILELEVENIKSLYNRYEDIYGLIERRNILWERLKRLMVSAKDPDRLFNNRGGALLREERERKDLQKELPKIEKILKSKLAIFEEEQSRPFTMNGQVVWNIIEDDWNEFHSKKDEEKFARKVANMNTLAVESRLGTNVAAGVKRKAPTSARAQPVSNKMHKAEGASDTSTSSSLLSTNSKKNKNTFNSTALSSCSTALNSLKKKAATTASKYKTPAEKKPRNIPTPSTVTLMSSQRDIPYALMTPSNMSSSSSYSLFQEHLDGRNDTQKTPCRSTLTPGNVLRPRNTPLPAHSSPKTPKTPFYRTRNNTMSTNKKNAQHKSPFKVGSSTKIPTLTVPTKSPRAAAAGTAQLKTPRRNLPIII